MVVVVVAGDDRRRVAGCVRSLVDVATHSDVAKHHHDHY